MRAQFGRALRAIRRARGYSQEELGSAASLTGIGLYEREQRLPTLQTIIALSEVLDVLPATLVAAALPEHTADKEAFFKRLELELREIEQAAGRDGDAPRS